MGVSNFIEQWNAAMEMHRGSIRKTIDEVRKNYPNAKITTLHDTILIEIYQSEKKSEYIIMPRTRLAYPRPAHPGFTHDDLQDPKFAPQEGMDMREHYTGLAMQALLSQVPLQTISEDHCAKVKRWAEYMGKLMAPLLLLVMLCTSAAASTVTLTLDLQYANPMNTLGGGQWSIRGTSSDYGIAGVDLYLQGFTPAMTTPMAPLGVTQDGKSAGFGTYLALTTTNGLTELLAGQSVTATLFYGVGTLHNGVPGAIGPPVSLAMSAGVPWATGSAGVAATLFAGAFAAGGTPQWYAGDSTHHNGATVLTTLPWQIGSIQQATSVNLVTASNLGLPGDFNHDGSVDAADYTVWCDTFLDETSFLIWKTHFGEKLNPGSGGLGVSAVPEPSTLQIVTLFAAFVGLLLGITNFVHRGRR